MDETKGIGAVLAAIRDFFNPKFDNINGITAIYTSTDGETETVWFEKTGKSVTNGGVVYYEWEYDSWGTDVYTLSSCPALKDDVYEEDEDGNMTSNGSVGNIRYADGSVAKQVKNIIPTDYATTNDISGLSTLLTTNLATSVQVDTFESAALEKRVIEANDDYDYWVVATDSSTVNCPIVGWWSDQDLGDEGDIIYLGSYLAKATGYKFAYVSDFSTNKGKIYVLVNGKYVETPYGGKNKIKGKLTQIDQKTGEIATLIGEPEEGQEATLFKAIAAGGGGGGGSTDELKAMLQKIIDAHFITDSEINFNGYTFADGYASTNVCECLSNSKYLVSVDDDTITSLSSVVNFTYGTNLTYVRLNNLTSATATNVFRGLTKLTEVLLPKLTDINETSSCAIFYGCTNITHIDLTAIQKFSYPTSVFASCTNLIDIECGGGFVGSTSLVSWNPTVVLADATKKATLLQNIREHIVANLPTLTTEGYAITFSTAVKAAIQADTETAEAFTKKGWSIA